MDEGYIKFQTDWEESPALPAPQLADLISCRQEMYRQELIGAYPDGIGFGNISMRWGGGNEFVITGSATGGVAQIGPEHCTVVDSVEVENNRVHCRGPIVASSESMSHAMIYRACPEAQVAIHVHDLAAWQRLLHQVPTTDNSASYGSPEMAYSILDLFENTELQRIKLFVMEGHREGLFAFGKDFGEAMAVLRKYEVY